MTIFEAQYGMYAKHPESTETFIRKDIDPSSTIEQCLNSPCDSVEEYQNRRECIGSYLETDRTTKDTKLQVEFALQQLKEQFADLHEQAISRAMGILALHQSIIDQTINKGLASTPSVDYSHNVVVQRARATVKRTNLLYPEALTEHS